MTYQSAAADGGHDLSSSGRDRTARPRSRRDALVLAVAALLYVVAFVAVQPLFGADGAALLAPLPVLASGWLLGLWRGALAGAIVYLLSTFLLGFYAGVRGPAVGAGGGLGLPVLVAVGAAVGWLCDLQRRLDRELRRREALLRLAHRLAGEAAAPAVFAELLAETVGLTGADGGAVFAWEEARSALVAVKSTLPELAEGTVVPAGQGGMWLAFRGRTPVLVADYPTAESSLPTLVAAGVRAAASVPLLHEGHALGALAVWTTTPGRRFDADDAALLELLGATAAAVLVGLERTRLEGVLLAARTAQHELSNRLALTLGYAEVLATDPRLPSALRGPAEQAALGARGAGDALAGLAEVTEIREIAWGGGLGATLDLGLADRERAADRSG